MAENAAAARLARLAAAGGDGIDVKGLLDAVLLAAARSQAEGGTSDRADPRAAGGEAGRREQDQVESPPPARDDLLPGRRDTTNTASVWLEDPAGGHTVPGRRTSVGRATALPDALELGRALRPLRRPWLSGAHQRLDVDATVEHYTRTGMLIPQLSAAPERWLELIVVLDRGTAMAVWDEAARALTKTLHALAAFRDVRVWHLDHPPGATPVLHDHHGNALPLTPGAADLGRPARRLLLVVSDCAAPAWRQDTLWQTLHAWGTAAPVALINPLPKRLWQRSGLDLPRTTATATVPASPGSQLSYRRPRLLRDTENTKPWQALPVLQLAPDQVLMWARTLMRTDPTGCEAVLVPATGRPPLRRRRPGPTARPDSALTDAQVLAHAEAFTDDGESPAVRLAIAASSLDSFTLPVLDVLRERLVPEATLADTAEFLTAGLLTATRHESADTAYRFHPAAAAHLTGLLTRDQLWDSYFALSDHLAAHVQAPHGIPVVLHAPQSDETLPTSIRSIAYAAATTARLLGVEPTDPPESSNPSAQPRSTPSSNSWQARITCGGRVVGAGFLVSERHVLTAAHVVAADLTEPVSVSFPMGASPDQAIPVRVVTQADWSGAVDDPGDLAVLELDHDVPIAPAEFAELSEAGGDPRPKLLAYGFPRNYDEGMLTELRVASPELLFGEWTQLESWSSHGSPLAPGFSGAAVSLAGSGRVVGMVTAFDRGESRLNGLMMPVNAMARYWPPLGDLLPASSFSRPQREGLRHLIEAVAQQEGDGECDPNRLCAEAVGPFGPPLPRRLDSLWEAAWFLLSEVDDEQAIVRFTDRLADFAQDHNTRLALRSWPHRRSPTVLVLTALPVEYNAVRQHLTDVTELIDSPGARFVWGVLPGTPWHIVLAQTGKSHAATAMFAEHTYNEFQPDAVLFVGVAMGLNDAVELGDVVIAEKVHHVSGENRPPRHLRQAAHAALGAATTVHFESIVVEELVHDSSESTVPTDGYADAVALEMEAAGLVQEYLHNLGFQFLTIRGISGRADGSHTRNAQHRAAQAAASAAMSVLSRLTPRDQPTEPY